MTVFLFFRWQQRYEFQKHQIIKEKLALALDRKRRELSINNYNKKINDERQRIEGLEILFYTQLIRTII